MPIPARRGHLNGHLEILLRTKDLAMAPRFRFLPDLQDPSDNPIFSAAGDAIYASFIPSAGNGVGMEMSPTSLFSTGTTCTTTHSVCSSSAVVTSAAICTNLLFHA